MPLYLTRFSYTPATWAKLIKNPEDRRAAATQYIEAVGGKLHGFWYAFGDHDAPLQLAAHLHPRRVARPLSAQQRAHDRKAEPVGKPTSKTTTANHSDRKQSAQM